MVATHGPGWQLAPSLTSLFTQADIFYPGRSELSDGSIGDASHQSRPSDHNPSHGYVHAGDITHSPPIFDAHGWARRLAGARDPRVAYIISNKEIWTPNTGWRGYTGSNPHTKHVHVSILHTTIARNDTSDWHLARTPSGGLHMDPDVAQAFKDINSRDELIIEQNKETIALLRSIDAKLDHHDPATATADAIIDKLKERL